MKQYTKHKRIFIIGHSGAGKGILAQAVAKKLGWQYIDMDFALEPSIGRRASEIVTSQGEQAFHHCLTEILQHQLSKENSVVTTDDSIICDDINRDLLSKEFTVYVQVSTAVQLERISHNRPLLPVADYAGFLNQLRQERDHLYEQVASYTLSSDDGDIEAHALNIIAAFEK